MMVGETRNDVVAQIVLSTIVSTLVPYSLTPITYRLGEAITAREALRVCSLIGASTMPFNTCG